MKSHIFELVKLCIILRISNIYNFKYSLVCYTFDSHPPDRKVDDTPSEASDLPKSYQNQGLNR